MGRPLRRLAAFAGATVVLGLATVPAASAGVSPSKPAAATGDPVSLVGLGSDDPAKEVQTWASELYGKSKSVTLTYDVVGGYEGRTDYVNGIGDFVVSGLPWTASQLSALPASDGGLISAPFMVSAVGLALAWGPTYELNRTCAEGESGCVPTSQYNGPVDIPASTLTDLVWGSITDPSSNGTLTDPSILSATASQIPQGADAAAPTISVAANEQVLPSPVSLLRSDPSETNYYLQAYAQAAAPGEFALIPHIKGSISEFLQGENTDSQYVVTYNGADAQVGFLTDEGGSVVADNPQGVIAALPPSALTGASYYLPPGATFSGSNPAYPPAWIGVQNASAQYVTPNPATIDAAVDAGGATPLYALSNPVPGTTPAYPLTYVDDIYVPAHGLTADKTEAIATIMRYVATAGQDATEADNDGQLSPSLVQQALAAANQVVASNCTASTEEVTVSSDLGRFAPTLVAMDGKTVAQRQAEIDAIGPMLHCVTVPTPTSTSTTVPATTTTTIHHSTTTIEQSTGGGGGYTPVTTLAPVTSTTSGHQTVTTKPGTTTTTTTAPAITGPVTLLDLPMPVPHGAAVFERLAGLIIGAVAFLLLWRARGAVMKLFGS